LTFKPARAHQQITAPEEWVSWFNQNHRGSVLCPKLGYVPLGNENAASTGYHEGGVYVDKAGDLTTRSLLDETTHAQYLIERPPRVCMKSLETPVRQGCFQRSMTKYQGFSYRA